MGPPRKSVSRGTGELANDPERRNRTQAKARVPLGDEDPERVNRTMPKASMPVDPEREKATSARARNPLPRGARSKADPARAEEEEYRTGPSYAALDDVALGQAEAPDEGLAGSQLEGEGLEALDPEVGSRTRALKAHEVDDEDDDGGGALEDDSDDDEAREDENATRAGPPIKLEIFGGPDAGKRRRFKGARMVIGRTPGVDLRLKDQSVSRRHIELVQGSEGVLLRDLGSGNGTKVNGARVAEKMLEHGDEIHIGKTKIRFVDEVAAFRKAREATEKKEAEEKAKAEAEAEAKAKAEAEAQAKAEASGAAVDPTGESALESGPKTTSIPVSARRPVRGGRREGVGNAWQRLSPRLKLTAIGVGVLVLLILIVAVVARPSGPPPVDPAQSAAEQKMQDARAAVKVADYETAVQLIEEAEKLQPGIDRSKLGNQAREELALSRALDEARSHLAAHRFEDARRVLDKAPQGTKKSEEAKLQLKQDLEAAQVAYKKEQIDEMLASGEAEAARVLLGELPVEEQEPSARKIAEFERQLEALKKEEATQKAKLAGYSAQQRQAARAEEMLAAFSTVERKFAGEEWDRAASECNRVIDQAGGDREITERAHLLQTTIPSFGRAYDEGMKKFRQGALAQAARPLRQALALYKKAQLERNKFKSELETKLADAALAAGREALIRDDLVTAFQSFHEVTSFDPADSKARDGLSTVEGKAQELYQMAYAERDHDPAAALKKFRVVVGSTDPSSTLHEKAKNLIAAMAP